MTAGRADYWLPSPKALYSFCRQKYTQAVSLWLLSNGPFLVPKRLATLRAARTASVKGCRMPALRGGQARYQQTARAGVLQAAREETAEWTDAVGTAAMAMGFVGVKLG